MQLSIMVPDYDELEDDRIDRIWLAKTIVYNISNFVRDLKYYVENDISLSGKKFIRIRLQKIKEDMKNRCCLSIKQKEIVREMMDAITVLIKQLVNKPTVRICNEDYQKYIKDIKESWVTENDFKYNS